MNVLRGFTSFIGNPSGSSPRKNNESEDSLSFVDFIDIR